VENDREKQNKKVFCSYLKKDNDWCEILETKCLPFIRKKKQKCAFADHYEWLTKLSEQSASDSVKKSIIDGVKANWKNHLAGLDNNTGNKGLTAGPLERAIREEMSAQIGRMGVEVKHGRLPQDFQVPGLEKSPFDCYLRKGSCPTSFISVKTWFTPEAARETFASAYLIKYWQGQVACRFFMVALNPVDQWNELIKSLKPSLDLEGVYSLSGEPYFDKLIEELEDIYGHQPL